MNKGDFKTEYVKPMLSKALGSDVTIDQTNKILDVILQAIVMATDEDGELVLAEFGKFTITEREARTARNPKSGKNVKVPARDYLRFNPAPAANDFINRKRKSA